MPPRPLGRPAATQHLGALDPRFWQLFGSLGLPGWLFPVESIADGRTGWPIFVAHVADPRGED